MNPHREVLEPRQHTVLQRLAGPLAARDFYLAGGTAIALHLGHRRSVDLDWFTSQRVEDPRALVGRLRDDGVRIDDAQTQRGTVHGAVDGVRVSLMEFRYPLLTPVDRFDDVPIATLDDLAPMKLSAVAQRGTRRDFVDIHALARDFRPLPEMLALYRRKFEVEDLTHVLYGLAYFDDAEREQMPSMLRDTDWETVKAELKRSIRAL